MAARVFVLRKQQSAQTAGKNYLRARKVRGYPLPKGGWKIYCLKHQKGEGQAAGNPPQSNPPPANKPKPAPALNPKGLHLQKVGMKCWKG